MLVDGKKIADVILRQASASVKTSADKQDKLNVAAIIVGDNPELRKFVDLKKKAAEKIGVGFRIYEFPADISNSELRKRLNDIVKATTINGVIIELPLPKSINTQSILNVIPQEKDIDALSEKSQGAFFANRSKILPPAVEAVKQILGFHIIEIKGKRAAVFGYGLLVGKPLSHWLNSQGATVTVIDEFTQNPGEISKSCDIVITGVGKKDLINSDMVKQGATVIDFGKDVDFDSVSKKAGLITPHTGGVGPIVVATVFKNLVDLWI